MLQTYKSYTRRTLAMLLAVLVAVGALFSGSFPVHAADGTISYKAGANIPYGSYFTSRMSFDGSNTAYCVEPLKKTPSSGSYSYDLLSQNSPLRKALYYLNGGYGYDKVVKDKYFSGWSDDNSYVIGHLVVAYIYAGNSADTGAFHGAPQSYIDKALEVASAIQGLPNPPEGFRAFIVPGQGSQTIAGSWYQVPNGWIELKKSSANGSVSDGNPNYSLKGAVYGIYQGEKLIQKLTTDENGYARSGELEEGDTLTPKGSSITEGKTKPKPLHTEATLLSAMETAGKEIEDDALRQAMKDCGIGTPATRASIIETLFKRGYMERCKKSLVPTEKGLALNSVVKTMRIADVAMTGEWEKELARIERGELSDDTFRKEIEAYTREITSELISCDKLFGSRDSGCACPKCGTGRMRFYGKVVRCDNTECGLPVFRLKAGRTLSDDEIKDLLTEGHTKLLKGFKSKQGKSFDAVVAFDGEYNTTFVFPEAKKDKKFSGRKK